MIFWLLYTQYLSSQRECKPAVREHCLFIANQVFSVCYYANQTFPGHAPTSVISTVQRLILKKTYKGAVAQLELWHIQFYGAIAFEIITRPGHVWADWRAVHRRLFHVCRFLRVRHLEVSSSTNTDNPQRKPQCQSERYKKHINILTWT